MFWKFPLARPRLPSPRHGSRQPPLHKMLTKSSAVSIAAPRRSLTAAHNITTSYFPSFNWWDANKFTERIWVDKHSLWMSKFNNRQTGESLDNNQTIPTSIDISRYLEVSMYQLYLVAVWMNMYVLLDGKSLRSGDKFAVRPPLPRCHRLQDKV